MERAPELTKWIAEWFEAASRGDVAFAERRISREAGALVIPKNGSRVRG